ncbi:MAG: aldolase/citrate lyase family protein [Spirochaetales bacterium]
MYGLEVDLFAQMTRLRDEFGVEYLKAEFEAEGSSFRDLVRLRRLSASAGMGLLIKIGGCEVVRDLRDALELGADAIVAPMIESPFALAKFWEAANKVFRTGRRPRLAFNVETRACVENLDGILEYGLGKMDGFTIGRSDLSGSYFDPFVTPDSAFLLDIVEDVASRAATAGWDVWMGGSLSQKSIAVLEQRPRLRQAVRHYETRKVVLPGAQVFARPEIVGEALKFEELYLLSRKEILDDATADDRQRLAVLKSRR